MAMDTATGGWPQGPQVVLRRAIQLRIVMIVMQMLAEVALSFNEVFVMIGQI
jgi:hypothetical protein